MKKQTNKLQVNQATVRWWEDTPLNINLSPLIINTSVGTAPTDTLPPSFQVQQISVSAKFPGM